MRDHDGRHYRNRALPGQGYGDICAALGLDIDAPVQSILTAIDAIKQRSSKPQKERKRRADTTLHPVAD